MNKRNVIFLVVLGLTLAAAAFGAYASGYDALLPLLVDLPSWEAQPAEGAQARAEGVRAVTAFRSYESGDRTLEVNLLVGVQPGLTWMPEYKEGYKVETPEGVMEVKKINGFLVSCTFDRENNSGGVLVLLNDGSADPSRGAVLVLGFEGVGLDEMLKIAQLFNWAKMNEQIARLK